MYINQACNARLIRIARCEEPQGETRRGSFAAQQCEETADTYVVHVKALLHRAPGRPGVSEEREGRQIGKEKQGWII